jgi:hypothetical protein
MHIGRLTGSRAAWLGGAGIGCPGTPAEGGDQVVSLVQTATGHLRGNRQEERGEGKAGGFSSSRGWMMQGHQPARGGWFACQCAVL